MTEPRIPGQDEPEARPAFVGKSERRAAPESPPLPPQRRVGFAVIGLGRLSLEAILPALASCKLVRLAAVMTGDKEKGARVARQYGAPADAVYGYDEWDALGRNKDIDVVYVVTPNGMHLDQVQQAARVGKHVLCEKPMANTSVEAEQMIDACKRAGVTLMIAYRCQYEPFNQEVTRLTRCGEFGALKMIEAHNGQVQDTADQWRHRKALAGGGALPDIGLYCLNFARFVTGEEPHEVMAWAWSTPGDPRFQEIEENIVWQMRFPSGVVARLSSAYDAHEARPARLYFQKAVVKLEPAFAYQGHRLNILHRSPDRADVEINEERLIGPKNQFGAEMDHMADCILTGRRPRTPGEEGLQDQRLMEAIYRSAAENRPVLLPALQGLDLFRGPPLAHATST
jgi:predicted dehydrogenase